MKDRKIFVLCPDDDNPTGGVKILYRHVDILNAAGFNASILHWKKGFRCTWFENSTRIASLQEISRDEIDVLVLPETSFSPDRNYIKFPRSHLLQPRSKRIFSLEGIKKVIFNQNAYYTFRNFAPGADNAVMGYSDPDLLAVLVVSEDNRDYLAHAFPGVTIYRIYNSIDTEKFAFSGKKEKIISYMPRKHQDEAQQVLNILKLRSAMEDFRIVPIGNMSEGQVAGILRQSAFFFSFGYPEGFSLPPAEAMSCGCIVVGYDGFAGREYFRSEFSFPVENANVLQFARVAENVLRAYGADPRSFVNMARTASEFIAREYSAQREREGIVSAWTKILSGMGE